MADWRSGADEVEPGAVPVDLAAGGAEERLLQLLGDRAAAVRTDLPVVDLPDRGDLRGRSREQRLVDRLQIHTGQVPLHDLVALVAGDRDDGLPGEPIQAAGGERRREHDAVPDDENVLP